MSNTLFASGEGDCPDLSAEQVEYWEVWQRCLMEMMKAARNEGFPH